MKSATRKLIPWDGFDLDYPSKIAPACRQIAEMLNDGEWHQWSETTGAVTVEHELKPKTVCNLLHGMVKTGGIERRGNYDHSGDKREARVKAC
jgi:hypothetical protein